MGGTQSAQSGQKHTLVSLNQARRVQRQKVLGHTMPTEEHKPTCNMIYEEEPQVQTVSKAQPKLGS